jgi:hypothetical protein
MTMHPVRRCSPCDENWPATSTYNLCPRCQRNTYASTDDVAPDRAAALKQAARYQAIRDFDAQADAAAQQRADDWAAEMNALLALTPSIPDPTPDPAPLKYWDDDRA